MTQIAAQLIGGQLAKTLDVAFGPLTAGIAALKEELNKTVAAWNPITTMVKAFGDAIKVQEKTLSLNISFQKSFQAVEKLREQGAIQLDLMEAQKVLVQNFDAGIRSNSGGLAKLQEEMRITGQKDTALRKAMVDLSIASRDNEESLDSVSKTNLELSQKYKVSNERLAEAMASMSKDVKGLGMITGLTGPMQNLAQGFQAAAAGRLSQSQIANMIDFLARGTMEARSARATLGISENALQDAIKLNGKGQQQVEFIKSNIVDVIERRLQSFGIKSTDDIQMLDTYLMGFQGNIRDLVETTTILSNTNTDAVTAFNEQLKLDAQETNRMTTINATLESTMSEFKAWVVKNLPEIQRIIIGIGKMVSDMIKWFSEKLGYENPLGGWEARNYITGGSINKEFLDQFRRDYGNFSDKQIKDVLTEDFDISPLGIFNMLNTTGLSTSDKDFLKRYITKNIDSDTLMEDLASKDINGVIAGENIPPIQRAIIQKALSRRAATEGRFPLKFKPTEEMLWTLAQPKSKSDEELKQQLTELTQELRRRNDIDSLSVTNNNGGS